MELETKGPFDAVAIERCRAKCTIISESGQSARRAGAGNIVYLGSYCKLHFWEGGWAKQCENGHRVLTNSWEARRLLAVAVLQLRSVSAQTFWIDVRGPTLVVCWQDSWALVMGTIWFDRVGKESNCCAVAQNVLHLVLLLHTDSSSAVQA